MVWDEPSRLADQPRVRDDRLGEPLRRTIAAKLSHMKKAVYTIMTDLQRGVNVWLNWRV
jgi:hypothetical protein